MFWLWFSVLMALFFLLLDRFIEKMYAYKITPHRETPADFGIPFDEVRIPTENESTLYSWWIPGQPDAPTLLLLHGWSRNLERMMRYIRHLHPLGYNLLAFDARNHGSSSAEPHPTVMTFTEDLCAAVHYLQAEKPQAAARLGVIGLSIGGGAALNAAGMCPRDIHSVATVGAIAHPVATMQEEMSRRHVPDFVIRAVLRWMSWRYGLDFDAIAPERHIRRAAARIFLIHGEKDTVVSLNQANRLLSAAPEGQAQLWVVPGKGHSDCCTHAEFWDRLTAFLQETLPLA